MCVAAAIGGAALAGGVASSVIQGNAATSAAQTQANAANQASAQQLAMFGQVRQSLAPFINQGVTANNQLSAALPGLTQPFQPTMAQLAATPGYQFTLQQGLESTQNSFAAQGLGASGAAQRGATQYAEGLAGTTYQQQFQNYLAQNQQIYNLLAGQQQLGEAAAAGVGSAGLQAASTAGNYLTSGAAATAAGQIGAANAASQGFGSAGNALTTSLLLSNSGLFGNSTTPASSETIYPTQQLPTTLGAFGGE